MALSQQPNVKFVNGRDSEGQLARILRLGPRNTKTWQTFANGQYIIELLPTDRYAMFIPDSPAQFLISRTLPFPTVPQLPQGVAVPDIDVICGLDINGTYGGVVDLRAGYLAPNVNQFYVFSTNVQCISILLFSGAP